MQIHCSDGRKEFRISATACVLAAGAINNVRIISQTLDTELNVPIRDHLSVGGVVRTSSPPLSMLRCGERLMGYRLDPESGANIFVQETRDLPNGSHFLEVFTVVDPVGGPAQLIARPTSNGANLSIHGNPQVITGDQILELKRIVQSEISNLCETAKPGTGVDLDWQLARQWARNVADSVATYTFAPGTYHHEWGTHSIGGNVVPIGTDLQVEGFERLYVAGPGTFPALGVSNPSLTTLAMSRWLGHRLTQELGVKKSSASIDLSLVHN